MTSPYAPDLGGEQGGWGNYLPGMQPPLHQYRRCQLQTVPDWCDAVGRPGYHHHRLSLAQAGVEGEAGALGGAGAGLDAAVGTQVVVGWTLSYGGRHFLVSNQTRPSTAATSRESKGGRGVWRT